VAALDGARATISDSTFTLCSAPMGGGAIYVRRGSALFMERMMFLSNDGGSRGGAVHGNENITVRNFNSQRDSTAYCICICICMYVCM
jgi:hypothetical protein